MRPPLLTVPLLLVALLPSPPAMTAPVTPAYPATRTVDVHTDLFGTRVEDPYRWLENDVRVDPEVRQWVDAQNGVSRQILDALPGRDAIQGALTRVWNQERQTVPVRRGGRLFFRRNSGLQNQSVLMVQEGPAGTPRVLIDPNPWASDGATALAEWAPSQDGKLLLYAVQDGGTDWRTLHVLSVDSGQLLADELRWVKFSGLVWSKDGSGFYYARFPEPKAGAEYQSLNLNLGIFFAAPIDDIQVYLAFYDITDGEAKKTKVFGSELFLGKRGDRVLFTSATISNENVPMNKKYLIAVESKNKIVARTEVTIKGTAPKYSGTVEFNDGEGSK